MEEKILEWFQHDPEENAYHIYVLCNSVQDKMSRNTKKSFKFILEKITEPPKPEWVQKYKKWSIYVDFRSLNLLNKEIPPYAFWYLKLDMYSKIFVTFIPHPAVEKYRIEAMTTLLLLPIQNLAIVFYQICQAKTCTCKFDIEWRTL